MQQVFHLFGILKEKILNDITFISKNTYFHTYLTNTTILVANLLLFGGKKISKSELCNFPNRAFGK